MREVLFRGKRLDYGIWEEGYYSPKDLPAYDAEPVDMPCIIRESDLLWCKVDPATVGQLSGVQDITGKKIFEGDIMKTAVSGLKRHTGVVEFIDGSFGLKCTDGSAFFLCFVAGCYQVIGNIHDNPELLEEAAPC